MKNSIKGIFFLGLLLGWGLPVLVSAFSSSTIEFKASIAIPAASVDLTDLDVRDSLNRKVESTAAVQQMKNLFVTGLNTLLTFNLTPMAQFVRDLMAQSWNVFAGSVSQALARTAGRMAAWIQGKKQLFVRGLVSALWFSLQPDPAGSRFSAGRNNFVSQTSSIISSTQILR